MDILYTMLNYGLYIDELEETYGIKPETAKKMLEEILLQKTPEIEVFINFLLRTSLKSNDPVKVLNADFKRNIDGEESFPNGYSSQVCFFCEELLDNYYNIQRHENKVDMREALKYFLSFVSNRIRRKWITTKSEYDYTRMSKYSQSGLNSLKKIANQRDIKLKELPKPKKSKSDFRNKYVITSKSNSSNPIVEEKDTITRDTEIDDTSIETSNKVFISKEDYQLILTKVKRLNAFFSNIFGETPENILKLENFTRNVNIIEFLNTIQILIDKIPTFDKRKEKVIGLFKDIQVIAQKYITTIEHFNDDNDER